jgi:hypothetical protein
MQIPLTLTTPEQHDFQDPTLELNEKRLNRWLTGLPVLNAGESLRMVLGALEPLNEQRLDVDKRLRLLTLYQASVKRLYETAEPLRLRQQPLSRQQRQDTIDDVERLCLATANGFKIVVKELYAAGGPQQDKNRFGQVLRWAVQQLAAALLHSYRYYRPEPAFVFLELNQLYRLARHYGVHDLTGNGENSTAQINLAGIYQAISLMALTDPFSIEEGQADQYFRVLLQHADGTRVVPGNSWQGIPEGLYFIDLQSDSRPRHCVHLQSPLAGDDPYILDARIPLRNMHSTLTAVPADRRRQRAEAGILKALLPEVTPRDKRRSERRADGRWIEVVLGLESICEWIIACQRGEQIEATRWWVKDASDQGYRLAWGASAASLLQVGDLVCVVGASGEEQRGLQLLVVRWVRDEREKGTELGVEKLQGVPSPVRLIVPDATQVEPHQVLFLPSSGSQGSVARLVAPLQVFKENRALSIHAGEREVSIRCGERVEAGAGFECFEFMAGA